MKMRVVSTVDWLVSLRKGEVIWKFQHRFLALTLQLIPK